MTPEDLVAEARRQVGAVKSRPPTRTELWLAMHLAEALGGCSIAFLRSHAIMNDLKKAELPKMNLDSQEPVI